MHGTLRASVLTWLAFGLLLAACRNMPSVRLGEIDKVYVTDPTGGDPGSFKLLNEAMHDEAVRALRRRGYVVTVTPEEAQAQLLAAWEEPQVAGSRPTGLRPVFRLVDREGRVLFLAQSAPLLAESFWSVPRVMHETDLAVAGLPEVRSGR